MNIERFENLLEEKGINTHSALLIKMSNYINNENHYNWAEKQKANFSKMLKGKRPFPQDFIIALEKVLNTSFAYLFFDNEVKAVNNYRNSGIRYTVAVGTEEAYENLAKETTNNGDLIIFNKDEYGKTLGDYIIEYQSIEGVRFLHEKYGLKYSKTNMGFVISCKNHYIFSYLRYSDELYLFQIAKLICENNEGKLFANIFDTFQLLNGYIDDRCFLLKDSCLDIILQSSEVVDALCEQKVINFSEVNRKLIPNPDDCLKGLFVNPILNKLLERAIDKELFDIAKKIIEYAKAFNLEQVEYLKDNSIIKENNVKIDEFGYIMIENIKKGNVVNYNRPVSPNLNNEIKSELNQLQKTVEEIKYIPEVLENGALKCKAKLDNGSIIKKSSKNAIEYEMMQCMQDNNFSMVPKYLGTTDGIDKFSYIEGKVEKYNRRIDKNILIQVVKFFKKFHTYSQKKLGKGKTYIHGDLNTTHLVVDNGELKGIIDWESCSIGNVEDEIIDLILNWTNISDYYRKNEYVYSEIKDILIAYEADKELLNRFADKMRKRINTRIQILSKDFEGYEYKYELLHHALSFIDLYGEKLNSLEF